MSEVNGKTGILGVIGYPIEHSFSPQMHNRALERLGLDYIYVAFPVLPGSLKDAIASLRALNISGINVTIPHKENVIKYLDKVDGLARKIGAVNTIVNSGGRLTGYNTDAYGFLNSLKKRFNPGGRNIFMLGAGGVGRAIGYALLTQKIKRIFISDLDNGRARELARTFGRSAAFVPYSGVKVRETLAGSDLFINATSAGMRPGDRCAVDPAWLHSGIFVYDVIYNRETELIKAAKRRKIPYLDGIDMFVNQGAVAFEYWMKKSAPVRVMYEAVRSALNR